MPTYLTVVSVCASLSLVCSRICLGWLQRSVAGGKAAWVSVAQPSASTHQSD